MDIFTALIGTELENIENAKNFTSKEEATNYVESEKGENEGGILTDEIEIEEGQEEQGEGQQNDNYSRLNNNWSVVDNKRVDGVLCRNKNNNDIWLVIVVEGKSITTDIIDLSDKECDECGGGLSPYSEEINQCDDCGDLFHEEQHIDQEYLNKLMKANKSVNIEVSENGESTIEKGEIEFQNKDKLPNIVENGEL